MRHNVDGLRRTRKVKRKEEKGGFAGTEIGVILKEITNCLLVRDWKCGHREGIVVAAPVNMLFVAHFIRVQLLSLRVCFDCSIIGLLRLGWMGFFFVY